MNKHEQKQCPRCGTGFECRVGDITRCQCYGIAMPAATEGWIAQQYSDCLCRTCLLQLKAMQLPQDNPAAYQAVFKKSST
jgi:Cysteine-rich CWC